MIPRTDAAWQTPDWQQALSRAFRTPEALYDYLGIDRATLPQAHAASRQFELRVPREYAALMERGNPQDPLLRQVLPSAEELIHRAGFSADPVGDHAATAGQGILHKYHGRILLITTGACAINCRYCFRRHYPYNEATAYENEWENVSRYLLAHPDINEVILSGGDPLSLSDQKLDRLLRQLEQIPHLQRLRIHSRLPVVLPQRITHEFTKLLEASRLKSILVLHANHSREITPDLQQALAPLQQNGTALLNQSVLLHGVNDSVDELARLSEALFSAAVLPYYLHRLDPVQGAAHFQVSDEKASLLMQRLRTMLPGYLVPRLVCEIPGQKAKSPL